MGGKELWERVSCVKECVYISGGNENRVKNYFSITESKQEVSK